MEENGIDGIESRRAICPTMNIMLSPHDDDAVLFAAFTCMREKPEVVICTDSYIQPERGEIGCSAYDRAVETKNACQVLNLSGIRLRIPDNQLTLEKLVTEFSEMKNAEIVYAPALQGGNEHHDLVSRAATDVFRDSVRYYPTYTRTELYTTGDIEIIPTPEELALKKRALDCYESQLRINLPHFQAVLGKSEWLMDNAKKRLHLGCGKDIRPGWINLDRTGAADVLCDITKSQLPFEDSSVDGIYSQDFLEHLPPESRVHVINECWRVLKPGARMEHYVPNAGSRNDFGSPTHLSHWNLQCFEHFDVDSYRWAKDHEYEGFIGGFRKVKAELVNFQKEDDGLVRAQSLHVVYEAIK